MPLRTKICKMFKPMTGLGCTIIILLLADLDNMPLDYLYYHKGWQSESAIRPIFGPRIRIHNSNCGFGLLIFITFVAPKILCNI